MRLAFGRTLQRRLARKTRQLHGALWGFTNLRANCTYLLVLAWLLTDLKIEQTENVARDELAESSTKTKIFSRSVEFSLNKKISWVGWHMQDKKFHLILVSIFT